MLLYKYLPLSWSEDLSEQEERLNYSRCLCIKDNTFWFSTPKMLNDPYDCKPSFKKIRRPDDMRRVLQDLNEEETKFVLKHYPTCKTKDEIIEHHQMFSNLRATWSGATSRQLSEYLFQTLATIIVNAKIQNVGILSLTTDYANCLMWSHYAKNHQGVCVEIEIPEKTKGLNKVVYTENQPSLMIYEGNHERYGRLTDIFYTKSKNWAYEKEWRIVAATGNEVKSVPETSITRIIYGLNTSETTKRKIAELIGRDIGTHQIRMRRNYVLQ